MNVLLRFLNHGVGVVRHHVLIHHRYCLHGEHVVEAFAVVTDVMAQKTV